MHYTVSTCSTDWSDHKRISAEIDGLQKTVEEGEDKLKAERSKLEEIKTRYSDFKEEESDLQQLQDAVKRMRDILLDISSKKNQITSKQDELSLIAPRASGKDMRTIERQHDSNSEEKDYLMKTISTLNKEAFDLNNEIQKVSLQATKAEKMVREKEDQFAQEQKANARRQELTTEINKATERENMVSTWIFLHSIL